jgi:hypothetical protein
MVTEDLTKDFINEISDEEVSFWFGKLRQEQQTEQMRKELLKFIDLRDAERDTHTIRIDSRVV